MSSTQCSSPANCDFEEVDDNFEFCSWANVNRELGPSRLVKKRIDSNPRASLVNGSLVTLTCKGNNLFWCAEAGGNSYIVADRGDLGEWELFKLYFNDDNTVSIMSMVNNKYAYLSSLNSYMYLTFNIDDSSKFELIANADNTYALRNKLTQKYVSAKNNPNINSFLLVANKGYRFLELPLDYNLNLTYHFSTLKRRYR